MNGSYTLIPDTTRTILIQYVRSPKKRGKFFSIDEYPVLAWAFFPEERDETPVAPITITGLVDNVEETGGNVLYAYRLAKPPTRRGLPVTYTWKFPGASRVEFSADDALAYAKLWAEDLYDSRNEQ